MTAASFSLVFLGVTLNAVAQLMLKLGTNRTGTLEFSLAAAASTGVRILSQWPFIVGFALYGISVVVWIAALTRVPVTIAYPMLSLGYVINAVLASRFLGESLSTTGWLGIALIGMGVWLLARPA